MKYEDTPPNTAMIQGMIDATGMDLRTAVNELIANSLDQDATKIDVTLTKETRSGIRCIKQLCVSDNGNGCPELRKMVELGSHVAFKHDTIGKFGVGFKDAVIWLGDRVTVDCMTRKGKRQCAVADWQYMMSIKKWSTGYEDDSVRNSHGISVVVEDLRGRRFKAWNQVPRYIAESFSAAIDAGVTISVDGKAVSSIPEPMLTDKIEFEDTFGGLHFKGIAGILIDKKAALSGWELRYQTQTIARGYTKDGFGSYSSQGFYGRFYMINADRKWHINRNKTGSEDLESILNCDNVQALIRPLLEKIKEQSASLKINLNQVNVELCLNKLLKKAKVRITDEDESCSLGTDNRDGTRGTRIGKKLGNGNSTRKKRNYDPLGKAKEKIRQAHTLRIVHHEAPEINGIGFIEVRDKGGIIIVNLDRSTEFGKAIWSNHDVLLHQAINILGLYFGLQVDILGQLQLPIGRLGESDHVKVSKAIMYLFEHVDLQEFHSTPIAA